MTCSAVAVGDMRLTRETELFHLPQASQRISRKARTHAISWLQAWVLSIALHTGKPRSTDP